MNAQVRELRVEANLNNLAVIAEFISDCCAQWQIDADNVFQVQLATDEAATNVIEHAYGDGSGELHVYCWRDDHDLFVKVNDRGQSFDPGQIRSPDLTGPLENRDIGGLGLHFMRTLMDEVHFSFGDEGNQLLMVKRGAAP